MNTSSPMKRKEKMYNAIAIILTIAVGIVFIAIIAESGCGCFTRSDMQTPTVGAVYQPDEGNFSVHVEKIDPDATNLSYVNFILLDERGTTVPGVQGELRNILDLDPDHKDTNLTFYDNDKDDKLSAGDVFWIKHTDFGGQAEPGYSLLLKFEPTGDKMNGGGTKLG